MTNEILNPPITCLLTYKIASADMFYAEVEQRDIYVCDRPANGFSIWGEIPGEEPRTAVELCEIFLEVALSCQGMPDATRARCRMKSFSERFGQLLAQHIKESSLLETLTDPAACVLKCLLESKHARFRLEYINHKYRFTVESCPIHEVAELTGLTEVELAHYGFNTMCQSLIDALNLDLSMFISVEALTGHPMSVTIDF